MYLKSSNVSHVPCQLGCERECTCVSFEVLVLVHVCTPSIISPSTYPTVPVCALSPPLSYRVAFMVSFRVIIYTLLPFGVYVDKGVACEW